MTAPIWNIRAEINRSQLLDIARNPAANPAVCVWYAFVTTGSLAPPSVLDGDEYYLYVWKGNEDKNELGDLRRENTMALGTRGRTFEVVCGYARTDGSLLMTIEKGKVTDISPALLRASEGNAKQVYLNALVLKHLMEGIEISDEDIYWVLQVMAMGIGDSVDVWAAVNKYLADDEDAEDLRVWLRRNRADARRYVEETVANFH